MHGSYHMEKEGLDRALKFLKENGVRVGVKWLRETHGEVKHVMMYGTLLRVSYNTKIDLP